MLTAMRDWRSWVMSCSALCVVALLGLSVVTELPAAFNRLREDRDRFGSMSKVERDQAYGSLVPLPMDVFGFYRAHLRPGDRYWVQVDPGAISEFADVPTMVRAVGRMALMPAVEVEHVEDADVILSWNTDPALLQLDYSEQERAGLQLLFVSRVKR